MECNTSKKVFILVFVILFCTTEVLCGVTEEQMMAAGKMMRDICLPKFPKITTAIADDIQKGQIPTDKDGKCYVNCLMEMMQTIKKGKFLYESSLKQVEVMLPDAHKDTYRAGINTCKNSANGIKNNCDAAIALLTCMRKEIPDMLFP